MSEEKIVIGHADNCPVNAPDFVPWMGRTENRPKTWPTCNCDFMARLQNELAPPSTFRELLIGCGHSRLKKLSSVDGNPNWRNLVTLDKNLACDPDVWSDINHVGMWNITLRRNAVPLCDLPWYSTADVFTDDAFDEIHAYEVLEHLGELGDADAFFAHFSEIWRILKPGGYLYATVPSRFSSWLWGDPSHRRAIVPESLVFLDQSQYIAQLDGEHRSPMSDFRGIYKADFRCVQRADNRETFAFVLQAVKPSRCTK